MVEIEYYIIFIIIFITIPFSVFLLFVWKISQLINNLEEIYNPLGRKSQGVTSFSNRH